MENKLQELTRKLYDEGLEKGRAEADKLVADARREAEKIVSDARSEAAEIVSRARAEAEDAGKNILTEVALAGRQAVAYSIFDENMVSYKGMKTKCFASINTNRCRKGR